MNRYLIQIKRELWEHKGALITTPLVVLTICVVLTILAGLAGRDVVQGGQFISQHDGMMSFYSFSSDGQQQSFIYHKGINGLSNITDMTTQNPATMLEQNPAMSLLPALPYIAFDHLAWLIGLIYLLSCLFTDRKDKSILFWKSMPVSEWQNVLTKAFIAAFIIPATAWLAASAYNLFYLLFMTIWSFFSSVHHPDLLFQPQAVLATAWSFLGSYLATSIWMLPFIGWVLLVSASAKKTPFLYLVLPLLALVLIEYTVLGSHHISQIIGSYINVSDPRTEQNMLNVSGWYHIQNVLSSVQCWLGLAASAGLLYATVWLRENRFEN
ncbi:hypothetical protein [Marinomonas spartinae]|uniref:hypothetical protein n=1 Tax=Marinomonas spartinae TaxID=1792290 RepID=UPI0018F14786|nr:hypothetical protein [Marinomonas spartinae]MBJ7555024.1 hypothetical protein [Marinomonas spartinae]